MSIIPDTLLVLGAQNHQIQDQTLERADIYPVQLVRDSEVVPIPFFNSWGEHGVSCFAWHPADPLTLYVTTSADLVRLDLRTGATHNISIPAMADVHEISVIGETLWISNTAYDEVIAYDLNEQRVCQRISLTAYRSDVQITENIASTHIESMQAIDKFHCNQIFEGYDGNLYVLVHHVTGKQLVKLVANKLLKNQGNGGVINLTTGEAILLRLYGPHSVRKVGGLYWAFDSGNAMINIYNQDWNLQRQLTSRGIGRGAAVSADEQWFYAGVSAIRKRYLGVIPAHKLQLENMVQVFSTGNQELHCEIVIPNIEQLNDIYVPDAEQLEYLLAL
jgi:hypothetical protein